ncbi:HAD family hydrolase [Paenibacillus sp. MAHUQ-46]|uniref:HAD family hydrolase n=2 Tax=Paenibacillus TaxID=44249 RepID=A0A934J564_9BACL|nr:HAD family hydrolase [Paenibacillus roseus]MBJ6360562.1 HAD family hydrolase [Paenibacillus roseus]
MYKNFDAIIFDLDDTLIDDHGNWIRSVERISSFIVSTFNVGPSISEQDIFQSYLLISDELWSNYESRLKPLGNSIEIRKFVWNEALTNIQVFLEKQHLEDLVREFSVYREQIFPDMRLREKLLKLKRKYKLAICTNGTKETQFIKIEKAGLEGIFDTIICSDDVDVRKPHPYIYNYCVEQLGTSVDQCIFVGDSWEYDIVGALDIHMRCAWILKNDSKMNINVPAQVSIYSSAVQFIDSIFNVENQSC